jgi:hypothetical protein
VLPSLTEYYSASLAPGSATLLHMRRGWKPAVMQKSCASCEVNISDPPGLAELELLAGLLREARRGLPLGVTLSNHYLRYRLIPPPPLAMPSAGVQALIQHCFRSTYGDVVDNWLIYLDPMPSQGDRLACAVDKTLLEGLKAVAEKAGLRLVSAQPYLMSGFNFACRHIDSTPACFVQVEAGRIMLATLHNKNWLGLRAVAASPQWEEELSAHIEREILFAGWENINPTIFLHAPETLRVVASKQMQRWQLKHVSLQPIVGYIAQLDAPYSLALSGVR